MLTKDKRLEVSFFLNTLPFARYVVNLLMEKTIERKININRFLQPIRGEGQATQIQHGYSTNAHNNSHTWIIKITETSTKHQIDTCIRISVLLTRT